MDTIHVIRATLFLRFSRHEPVFTTPESPRESEARPFRAIHVQRPNLRPAQFEVQTSAHSGGSRLRVAEEAGGEV